MKKKDQLGINPSTAQSKLVRDVLYKYASIAGHMNCYHCNKYIERIDFSIEHKKPWLDSESPIEMFFDLDNIAFSHLLCNIKAGRRPTKGNKSCGLSGYTRGCRCDTCRSAKASYAKSRYTTENRRVQYKKHGK